MRLKCTAILVIGACGGLAVAEAGAGDASRCWTLSAGERLRCYDLETGRPTPADPAIANDTPTGPGVVDAGRMTGYLAQRWGYDRNVGESRFTLDQYLGNYLIVRDSNAPNTLPYAPDAQGNPVYATVPIDLQHPEFKFQLSGKLRVADFAGAPPDGGPDIADAFGIWLAYTQQSHWQVFNGAQSRPFRETNYQPEAIFSIHPRLFVRERGSDEWNWRVFNLGAGHQSNGQSSPLSRSWNYAFAQLGFELDNERGQWSVVLRPWYRIPEGVDKDDNRNLTDYVGYGDIRGTWRRCDWEVSLMGRGNPATGKGAAQLDVSFPLRNGGDRYYPLLGYLQVFTGYGESLIDYNWRQTTAGIGFRLNDRRATGDGCGRG
jgi:phospholipase A1